VSAYGRAYVSSWYWQEWFSYRRLTKSALVALGVLWMLTEVLVFTEVSSRAVDLLKANWWLFPAGGAAWAVWANRPRLSVCSTLRDCDVRICIKVGDLFEGAGSFVVGCTTAFDTDMQRMLISEKSVQGQFTRRFFPTRPADLDDSLNLALQGPGVPQPTTDSGKAGKSLVYPIGTTVTLRPSGRTAYLCGISHMNAAGSARASLDDIKQALPALWEHIVTNGDHGDISVPILGSGFSRVPVNGETLVREILKSFIAACASQRPCNSLTVVLHPKDYYAGKFDLLELGAFLDHRCKYTELTSPKGAGSGQPI
jgi:Domain of unknown function (DUF6430)